MFRPGLLVVVVLCWSSFCYVAPHTINIRADIGGYGADTVLQKDPILCNLLTKDKCTEYEGKQMCPMKCGGKGNETQGHEGQGHGGQDNGGQDNAKPTKAPVHLTTKFGVRYRNDRRCGGKYLAQWGIAAECNPDSNDYCCSPIGYCGSTDAHCCDTCINYKDKYYPSPDPNAEEDPNCKSSDGFFKFGETCYKSFTDKTRNFPDSKTHCKNQGMILAGEPADPVRLRKYMVENMKNDKYHWLNGRGGIINPKTGRESLTWLATMKHIAIDHSKFVKIEIDDPPRDASGNACFVLQTQVWTLRDRPNRPYETYGCGIDIISYALCEVSTTTAEPTKAPVKMTTKKGAKWRTDRRCGGEFLAPWGLPAECNPNSRDYCCSPIGYCGSSDAHCCDTCINYKER